MSYKKSIIVSVFVCLLLYILNIISNNIIYHKLIEKIEKGYISGIEHELYNYNTTDYNSVIENHPYYAYDTTHISWSSAYIFEGIEYLYKLTNDNKYLNDWINLTEEIILRRDDYEGRISWDGQIYPLWSSTSRYNNGKFNIEDEYGKILAKIEFNGAGNDKVKISCIENKDGTFNLEITKQEKYFLLEGLKINDLQKRIKNEIYWKDYQSGEANKNVIEVQIISNKYKHIKNKDNQMLENISVPNTVHTSLILEPMVELYKILEVKNHPMAHTLRDRIRESIDAVIMLTYDEEGYFKEPCNSPTMFNGGKIIPWNQQAEMVAVIAKFSILDNDKTLQKLVKDWSKYFLSCSKRDEGILIWNYWEDPTGTITWKDSTNYGGRVAESIYDIYETGIAFTYEDILSITKLIDNNIIKNGRISARIDGSGSGHVENLSGYLKFYKYSKEMKFIDFIYYNDIKWYDLAKNLYLTNYEKYN